MVINMRAIIGILVNTASSHGKSEKSSHIIVREIIIVELME